uniref:Calcium-binding and coiled-coil domain-containing protein 2 n=1 Tax=Aotus nancymaae TaxID=37293 RepID=A0A2K5E722_AOTNA
MEKTVEDPPTSAVLLDHCYFSQVIFNSVEKFYIPAGDVTCHCTFTQYFIPHLNDWIGIFRVGWKTTREYYTFMWVNLPIDLNNKSAKQQEVQFKAYYLPKDDEYYQFCYVDQDGMVWGASIPFQFCPENEEDILVVTTQERRTIGRQKQNQKLSSENEKMGIRVDQPQKLVQGDQDKTEQLEHLFTEQRKDEKKLERTVEEMKQNETTAMKKQQELMDENFHLRRLSKNKIICNILQIEKERLEGENDLLKKENSRLLSYMGLDFNYLPYQVPTSDEGDTGQNPGLVYGNPYSDIQESSSPSPLSIKKCLICKADDICDHTLEQQQMQALCWNCPICGKIFPAREKQIFEDHVF